MSEKDDKDLWASYAQGVKKLGEKEEPKKKESTSRKERALKKAIQEKIEEKKDEPVFPPPPPPVPQIKPQPLDARIERNMSLGDVMVEARIDLHGRTEQEAYDDYLNFVQQQSGRGKRMLLVITGKSGILKKNVPRWSNTVPFNQYIMAVRMSAKQHGGEGAYYVLLHKKQR